MFRQFKKGSLAALAVGALVLASFYLTFGFGQTGGGTRTGGGGGGGGGGSGITGLTTGTMPVAASSTTIANSNPAITQAAGVTNLAPTTSFNATSTTSAVTFTGAGLNDFTKSGTYICGANQSYKVVIDATGTPDTFKWSHDGGATFYATAVAITGSAQALECGLSVTFAATTGHTLANAWAFTASQTSPIQIKNAAGTVVASVNQEGSGFIHSVTVDIGPTTNTGPGDQTKGILNWATTLIDIVPAPGPGKVINIVSWSSPSYKPGLAAYAGATPNVGLAFGLGGGTALLAQLGNFSLFGLNDTVVDNLTWLEILQILPSGGGGSLENLPVQFGAPNGSGIGPPQANFTSGDGSVRITVQYTIESIL